MIIERAVAGDEVLVASLYEELIRHLDATGTNYPRWGIGLYPTIETAAAALKAGALFVGRVDGEAAASVILNHDIPELYAGGEWTVNAPDERILAVHTLCVRPKFLRRGLAARLLAFAEGYGRENGCLAVRLDTAVQNLPGIALYEGHGYNCVGVVDLRLGREGLTVHRLYEKVL